METATATASSDGGNRRALIVGAGGIGCELLKNLVLTGFTELDVVSGQLCF